METSLTTNLVLGADCWTTNGMATRHADGRVSGHVQVMTPNGGVGIASESSDRLRDLAASLWMAADTLDAKTANEPAEVAS